MHFYKTPLFHYALFQKAEPNSPSAIDKGLVEERNILIKIDTNINLNVPLKLFFSLSKKIIFFRQVLANNNLLLKIYCENIVIKIDIDFNLNVLLKLFFSLSKKIIFFSPILANNNLPLKIYYESIVKIL